MLKHAKFPKIFLPDTKAGTIIGVVQEENDKFPQVFSPVHITGFTLTNGYNKGNTTNSPKFSRLYNGHMIAMDPTRGPNAVIWCGRPAKPQ